MIIKTTGLIIGMLILNQQVFASEHKHFKGEQAATLSEAMSLLSEKNKQLAQMVSKDTLALKEVGEIHQMTYSMENALKKIKSELKSIEALLEEVHQASEHNEPKKIIDHSKQYLDKAKHLTP